MPGKKENRPILKTPDGTGTAGIGETGRMAGTAKTVKTAKPVKTAKSVKTAKAAKAIKAEKTAKTAKPAAAAGSSGTQKTSKLKRSKAAVRKGTGLQDTLKKRSRQLRYLQYGLQAAIRILNALDRKTIYRR